MTVNIPILAFSLLLLWFPRTWLRLGKRVSAKPERRYNASKPERDPYDKTVNPLTEAAKSRNWVDLFRGAVGTYGLLDAGLRPPEGILGLDTLTTSLQGGALFLAMLLQMVRYEKRLSLFAPIYFLQGMGIGVAGGLVGILALLGSWALSPLLPGAGVLLFVQGAVLLVIGMLLKSAAPGMLMIVAGITLMPMLVSVLLRKKLSASLDKRFKVIAREDAAAAEAE